MNLPKYYANVCEEMPPEYSDYENFEVKFGYTPFLSFYLLTTFLTLYFTHFFPILNFYLSPS